MSDVLVLLRRECSALRQCARTFDPAALVAGDVASVMEEAARIEAVAATIKTLAAGRLAKLGTRDGPEPSTAHRLAKVSGTSVNDAKEALAAAAALGDLPEVDRAAREGRLSSRQTAIIARAASVARDATDDLLATAERGSLSELAQAAGAARAAADPDPEATRTRIGRSRSLRTWADPDGSFRLAYRDTPEKGADILAALAPFCDAAFKAARTDDRHESPEAYAADALLALARRTLGGADEEGTKSAAAKVIVKVDLFALLGGRPTRGETCEIAGCGPVAVSVVEELLTHRDTFVAAVITKGKRLTGVAHLGRCANAHQRTALEWLFPTCAVEGCGTRGHLEIDHTLDWSNTHRTVLDHLTPLCKPHHNMKTHRGWALVDGEGTRAFVGPKDPRHPKNAPRRRPGARAGPGSG